MGAQDKSTLLLLNLIKYQRPDLAKVYYVIDPFAWKYQVSISINRREKIVVKNKKKSNIFIDYSQTIDDVYENLEGYKPTKKRKVCIVFDYMITVMEAN